MFRESRRKNKKQILVLTAFLVGVAAIASAAFLYNLWWQTRNLVRFNCRPSQSDETLFSIDVKVDLTDGLNQNEAVGVATELWNKLVTERTQDQITEFHSTTSVNENGVWTIKLTWTRVSTAWYPGTHVPTTRIQYESLEASINPLDRTIIYNS